MVGEAPGSPRARVVSSETLSERGAVVIIEGGLDLANAAQLTTEISDRLAHGHLHFVVDLTRAAFLDSVAMTSLLAAIEPLRSEPDAVVALAGASGDVARSLAVSGVGDLFTSFPARQEAVDALHLRAPLCDDWRQVGRGRH